MILSRLLLRAGLLPVLLASGCARDSEQRPPSAAAEAPALDAEQFERPSPSAGVVVAFNAICSEPARRPIAREAGRRGFEPVAVSALREEAAAAAIPPDATAWRGPGEVGGAVLLWNPETGICEVRVQGVDPLVVGAEFARLPEALEEAGASVMRLQAAPAGAGAPRTRQMLLVSPGADPKRARVLRLGDGGAAGGDVVVLTARGIAPVP